MASNPVKLVIQATDTDGICASQSPAAAGNLLINGALTSGGVATLSAAHILTITTASNDVGKTWTITGKNADGITRVETVAGVNATSVNTVGYFKEVSQITLTGGGATTVVVGHTSTNGCVSEAIKLAPPRNGKKVSWQVNIPTGATATYTVQHTLMDQFNQSSSSTAVFNSNSAYTGLTANSDGYYLSPIRFIRLQSTAISLSIEMHVYETEE